MNERIRELIKQATHVEEPDGLFPREVFDEQKFAELIVRECIDVVPWQYEEKIKTHFGVK